MWRFRETAFLSQLAGISTELSWKSIFCIYVALLENMNSTADFIISSNADSWQVELYLFFWEEQKMGFTTCIEVPKQKKRNEAKQTNKKNKTEREWIENSVWILPSSSEDCEASWTKQSRVCEREVASDSWELGLTLTGLGILLLDTNDFIEHRH